jgi:hypothetical protein
MPTTEQAVESVLRHLGATIIRDIIYIIGGSTILLTFLYLYKRLPNGPIDIFYKVYFMALSWMTGFAVQEIFSTLRIVTTSYKKPGKILIIMLRLFTTGGRWDKLPSVDNIDIHKIDLCIDKHSDTKTWNRIERIISLKMVGSTMGSSLLITSILLFICDFKFQNSDKFELILGIIAFVFALAFIQINRIKTVQHYDTVLKTHDNCERCNGSGLIKK